MSIDSQQFQPMAVSGKVHLLGGCHANLELEQEVTVRLRSCRSWKSIWKSSSPSGAPYGGNERTLCAAVESKPSQGKSHQTLKTLGAGT